MKTLTPGLLEADDVYATHGCHLHHLTYPAVHGVDLWREHAEDQEICSIKQLAASHWSLTHLVQDGGVSRQDNMVLNESHPDPPGRPQLFLRGFKPVPLQLKVPLRGSLHSACREVQLPVNREDGCMM